MGNEILEAVNSLHEKIDDNSKETHRRIDGLVESVGEVQVSMKGVKVSLDTVEKDVNGHLKDHKQEDIETAKERRRAGWTIAEKIVGAILTLGVIFLAVRLGLT